MTLEVTIETQITAVEREIIARRRKYQRWVKQSRITQTRADAAIDEMRAVAKSLRELLKIKDTMHEGHEAERRMSQMAEQEESNV